ncbi:MAG: preprotein translocase subunit SecE [Clostridia bacterium]
MSEKEKSSKDTKALTDDKKTNKPAKKKSKWFKELKAEMKKIVWPTKDHVKTNTGIVLMTILIAILIVTSLDFVFQFISDALIALG